MLVLDSVSEEASNTSSFTSAEDETCEAKSRHRADEPATLDSVAKPSLPACKPLVASRCQQAADESDLLTSDGDQQVTEDPPRSSKTFHFRTRARQLSPGSRLRGMNKSKSVEVSLSCEADYAVEAVLKQVYQFSIHYSANFGENLVLVGNRQVLGNWDPAQGLMLSWSSGDLWSGSIELESDLELEYKYACVSPNTIRWEAGPNRSRSAEPATTSPVLLKNSWRN
jgi:hypothetical protein